MMKRQHFLFFKRTPYATRSALVVELGKSESTANRLVKRLIDIGMLKYVSSNKGGKWIVMFDDVRGRYKAPGDMSSTENSAQDKMYVNN